MISQKPILVTGATGSIGSALVKRLCETGKIVRVVVRNPEWATKLQTIQNMEIVLGDLSRPESLRGCAEGCSLVYHCAAKLSGSNWATSRAINVIGTQAIIDESVHSGIERFIYTSTIGVYGLCNVDIITEETPWSKTNNPYITTKQEADRVVGKAVTILPIVIARLGDAMGPGQFLWTISMIERIKKGVLPPPLDSESGFLNPIYIDNLIDALLLMGTHPAALGQVFNVVNGSPIRTSDYFRRLAQMAGKRITPMPAILQKGAIMLSMWNDQLRGREVLTTPETVNFILRKGKIYPTKLHSLLGWVPAVSQEEAFTRTEQWLIREGYIASK